MMIRFRLIFFFSLICILNINAVKNNLPDWVLTNPVDPAYYIGIGHAYKIKGQDNFKEEAKKMALNTLAGEISIQIFSSEEFISVVKNDKVKQEFSSLIQSRVKTELEGYEFVEEYDTKKEYWVFYRLSKIIYRENELKKMSDAVMNARSCFFTALDAGEKGDYKNAIIQFAKSIHHVRNYFNEYIDVEVNGQKVNLINSCFSKISAILAGLTIQPTFTTLDVKQGGDITSDQLMFKLKGSDNQSIAGFPLIGYYSERSIADYAKITGSNGEVNYNIQKIRSRNAQETFKISPDINAILLESATDYLVRKAILEYSTNSTEILINIVKPRIKLEVVNQFNDKKFEDNSVINIFRSQLSQAGYQLSDPADIQGVVLTQLSYLGNNNGVIQVQLGGNISFKNKDGKVIYASTINPVKGTQLTLEKASMDALKNFCAQIETKYCRELLESIVK